MLQSEPSTSECYFPVEIKQEKDSELLDKNNSNVEFSCTVMEDSSRSQLQRFSTLSAEDKKKELESPRNFEFVSCNEWNNDCNAFSMPVRIKK